jgi:N-acetylglutamate synthase-like GNAT family acetyltransferase
MATTRRARSADVAAVRQLVQAAYGHYPPVLGVTPAPLTADYAALVAAGAVHVAEQDGSVVGVLVLEPRPDHLLIENVAVAPSAQGHGVGSTLLALAEREAVLTGRAELRLYTHERMTENLAYYPRRGYTETHRTDDGTFQRVHFAKRLRAQLQGVPVIFS